MAAGKGLRLGNPFSKTLTPLSNGKTILQHQLDNLTHYFSIDDIVIVVGFKKELIMEASSEVAFIYNPLYEQTNTSKSLWMAIKKFRDHDIFCLYGDVVFDGRVIERMFVNMKEGQSCMCVNTLEVGEIMEAEETMY